jgi:hypothetical protein
MRVVRSSGLARFGASGWATENPGTEAPAPPCEGRIASAFGKPDDAARYFKLLKRF